MRRQALQTLDLGSGRCIRIRSTRQSGNGHGHPDLPSPALTYYRTSQRKVKFTKILELDSELCAVQKSGLIDKPLVSPPSRAGSGAHTNTFGDLLNLEGDRDVLVATAVDLMHGKFV